MHAHILLLSFIHILSIENMSEAGVTLEGLAKSQHATLPNQW